MTDRCPDTVIAAERAVLGAMLLDPAAVERVAPLLTPATFFRTAHGAIFRAICAVYDRGDPPDYISTCEALRLAGDLDPAGGPAAVAELMEYATTATNVHVHARIVADHHARREIARAGKALADGVALGADLPALTDDCRRALDTAELLDPGNQALLAKVLSGPDFMRTSFRRGTPLLGGGLYATGLVGLLYATSGLGKSFLADQLAHSIALGTPWLDSYDTPPGGVPVLYVQLEDPSAELQDRRRNWHPEGPANLHTITADDLGRTINAFSPADIAFLVRCTRSVEARLLILDPLVELHDEPEINETFRRIVRVGRHIALETGAAVLFVHHEGKPPADSKAARSDQDASRGGTSLIGGAKFAARLKRTPNGSHVLTFAKVSYGRAPADLHLRQNEHGWWIPTDAPVDRGDQALALLERILLTAGESGLTYDQLASGTQSSQQTVRSRLTRLAVLHGLRSFRDLNAGKTTRPVFVHPQWTSPGRNPVLMSSDDSGHIRTPSDEVAGW